MSETSFDLVFSALAHPDRRRIIDLLVEHGSLRAVDLAERFTVSRIAVLKHIRSLEAAGLIVSEKSGRERRLYFNAVPIQLIYDRWTDQYAGFWTARLADLRTRLETQAERSARPASTSKRKVRRA